MSGKARPLAWIREGECIRCISHAPNYGYPRIWKNGESRKIARLILIRRLGNIPPSIVSRHTCDHRWCIRPDHIISGTIADNNADQRGKPCRRQLGEAHHHSRLTPLRVLQIREATGLNIEIAKKFGITHQHVSKIRKRELWGHI